MPQKLPQKNQYTCTSSYFGHSMVEIEIHSETRIAIQDQSFCRFVGPSVLTRKPAEVPRKYMRIKCTSNFRSCNDLVQFVVDKCWTWNITWVLPLRRKNVRGINRKGGKNTKRKDHWYFVGSLELYDHNTCIGLVLGLQS